MPPPGLAAVVIARDEEDRLPATLASLAFADEVVVVVDEASRDRTAEVARASGARVALRVFDGFGPQKNAAFALSTAPWILSVDADEVVTPALAGEIARTIANGGEGRAAFRVPIRLEFQGRRLRFGRDTVVRPVRLFRRERARFTEDPVHERLVVDGPVGTLRAEVLHRSYRDLTHYLEKLDRYTSLAAARPSARSWGALLPLRVGWELFDRCVLRLGFLDGTAGLTYAALSAASTLLRSLKAGERKSLR